MKQQKSIGDKLKGALKGTVIASLLVGSLIGFSDSSFAAQVHNVTVKVNGVAIVMHEAPAYIDQKANVTFVPLRFVSEALGAEIDWTSNKAPITASIKEPEEHKVKVLLDQKKAEIDGKVKAIEAAPTLQSGRTMVPLRVISEGLGADVKWTAKKGGGGTVEINTPWETPDVPTTGNGSTTSNGPAWNPRSGQKEYGTLIFKPLTWNSKTRSLSFNIPKMPGKYPLVGFKQGSNKTEKIVLGKDYSFKNLPEDFKMDVSISGDEAMTEGLDRYTIMSYSYAVKNYPVDTNISKDSLVVLDQYNHVVSLDAVYSALGIKK